MSEILLGAGFGLLLFFVWLSFSRSFDNAFVALLKDLVCFILIGTLFGLLIALHKTHSISVIKHTESEIYYLEKISDLEDELIELKTEKETRD